MVTIKELAKHCNCSISTVSYALNGSKQVSETTREKILKAAKELNYTPNAFASSLKRKKSYNIGVVISGFDGPIHHNILAGISNRLKELNSKYHLLVTVSDEEMFLIKQKSIDLAIIMDARANDDIIKELAKIVPIITFDHYILGDNIYNTKMENTEGMYLQTLNLISKGCKNIAYLLGSSLSTHNKRRYEGYVKALRENNIEINNDIIFDADSFTEQRGFEVISEVISKYEKIPFDSLICANDELAIGAIKALENNGYKIPKDIMIAGFDNIIKGEYMTPSLSTISVDWKAYGNEITQLALDILDNKKVKDVIIPVQMIERESTKK